MTRCARCGLVEVAGDREDMPMCLPCERATLVDEMKFTETDAFHTMIGHRDHRIRELEAELMAYREAVRSVANAPDPVLTCDFCDAVATMSTDDLKTCCDEHTSIGNDLTYAAAWRTLLRLAGVTR